MLFTLIWLILPDNKNTRGYRLKIYRSLFFNGPIVFLDQSYILISVCGFLNTFYLRFDTWGNILNSLFSIILLAIVVVFPIFVGVFYNFKFKYSE